MANSRKTDINKIAFDLEMEHLFNDEWGLFNYLKDFRLFRQGHSKRITNILSKKDDWLQSQIYIFDYRYTISAGNSHRIYKQTVFFVESKALGLPSFWMKPESFFHKIAAFLGFKDINFDAFPDFSNQYYLKGEDEDYIRYTMNDQILKYFTIEKDWHLEGLNYYLILYRKGGYMPANQLKAFYQQGQKVLELFKTDPMV